ncbi:hypothetical protein [Actinokineospora sp. NPDC004072]
MTDGPDNRRRQPMLTIRTALLILASLLTATAAGLLMAHADHPPAHVILTAAACFAATMKFLDWLIG